MPEQGSSLVARGCAWLMWERLHNMLRLFDLRGLKFSFVIPVSIDCRGPETSAQSFFSCATHCATMECFQWWSQTSCACLKNIVSTGRDHGDLQNPELLRYLEPPKMGAWGPRSCHKWCDYLLKIFIVTSLYAYICPGTHKRAPNLCNDPFTIHLHYSDHDDPMMHSKCTLHERLVICKFATARGHT